jgi:hypothetical protein
MPNNFSDDYNRFIGEYITVVYEYGSKSKKLDCKLFDCYKSDSGDNYVVLKAYKNLIYHIKCSNLIYFIADYKDNYGPDTNSMSANTNAQREELPLKQSQDLKDSNNKNTSSNSNENSYNEKREENNLIPSENKLNPDTSQVSIVPPIIISDEHPINCIMTDMDLTPDKPVEELPLEQSLDLKDSYIKNSSVILNDRTNNDEIQENIIINSENGIDPDTSQVSIDNPTIIIDVHSIDHIMTDKNLNANKLINNHKDFCDYDSILEQYEKKATYIENCLSSPLAVFINWAFRGVNLTIYTTSGESICGEVVFNYNHIIALKSESITYYINPEQIEYFY